MTNYWMTNSWSTVAAEWVSPAPVLLEERVDEHAQFRDKSSVLIRPDDGNRVANRLSGVDPNLGLLSFATPDALRRRRLADHAGSGHTLVLDC